MQKASKLYRALIADGTLSATVMETTALVVTAAKRHELDEDRAAILGEAMALGAYFASWLKDGGDYMNLSVAGEGFRISVTSDGALRLSGHFEGETDAMKRGGVFALTRFTDGIPQTGTSDLSGGDLGEEFARYFLVSEQRLAAAVLAEKFENSRCVRAGALFLEALPGAKREEFERLKGLLPSKEELIFSLSHAEELLKSLFGAREQRELPISFRCRCTKRKASLAVKSLGREDALALIAERGDIEVRCPDCGKTYLFSENDIMELFKRHG